jgi:hypothetical protein
MQFSPLLSRLICVLKCLNNVPKSKKRVGGSDGLLEPPLKRTRPSNEKAEVDAFGRNVITCNTWTWCVWFPVWTCDARPPLGLAMAQAGTELLTAVAWVQSLDSQCGICQCYILPSVSWGWCSRPICSPNTKGPGHVGPLERVPFCVYLRHKYEAHY